MTTAPGARRQAATAFCAICTADIAGEPRRAPIGKGGAEVNVCDECHDETPIARMHERGYESTYDLQQGAGSTAEQFRRGARAANPRFDEQSAERSRVAIPYKGVSKGHRAIRVLRRDAMGRPIDNRAAYAIAVKRAGGSKITIAGMTSHYYVFQRALESKVEPPSATEAIAPIAKYRRR